MRGYDAIAYAVAILAGLLGQVGQANETIDFNRDIRPILSDRCFRCHGPDEEARQAELRLDVADNAEGPFQDRDGTPAIAPGDLAGSALWERINTSDADLVMPPVDANLKPLSPAQRALFKEWILGGAEYKQHWAFAPPTLQRVDPVSNRSWSSQRIDRFVMARLEKEGLEPRVSADKRTLVRRITFDVTGLPPTRESIRDFLSDESTDSYERLVDRLMAAPQYGEHMAKYWLDLVRFADTNGIHHDHYREMTPYRDWIIRAFNDNLPFDQFLNFQLAGDLYDEPTLDQQIASGFNRLHLVIDVGTALPEESFHRNVVDRVTAFGTALLGLTVQCAQCHDHKYDPVTQKDFYQLYAFFNNIDASPETPGKGVHAPYLELPTQQQRDRRDALDDEIAAVDLKIEELKKSLGQTEATNDSASGKASDPGESPTSQLEATEKRREELAEQRETLQQQVPVTLIMREREEVRPTHMHIRGAYDQLGDEVERATPEFLPPMFGTGQIKTRMDLARWVTSAENPLTARVAVNRFWQQLFGVGLVKTAEDFGIQGGWPSHPDLLDNLAHEFVASGWDVKSLIKSMVMSETYRQSSQADPDLFRSDPENRLLARGSRFRMDSEMIRDQILAVSGLLVPELYGKSVKPPQPPDLWKTVSMASSSTYSFAPDAGKNIYRRSIYSFWKRAMPPPQMTIFDAPTRESCIARRERTNTPLQALVLMNEEQYFKAARHMALDLLRRGASTDRQRLERVYESITSKLPDDAELSILENHLNVLRAAYVADAQLAEELTADAASIDDVARSDLAAYTMMINSLFNLDIAKTRE